MEEIWKDIPNYENLYQISSLARVKRLVGIRCKTERILKPSLRNGYYHVNLTKNAKGKSFYVHRLFAQSFIDNTFNKEQINHKNGIRTDNCLENLEWVTNLENQRHAWDILKRKSIWERKKGANNKLSKKVIQLSRKNVFISKYNGIHEASRKTGIDFRSISECCTGRIKTTHGFIFQYA